jgi:hypothetical protein
MNEGWKIFIIILVILIVGFASYPFLLSYVKSLPEPLPTVLALAWGYLLVIGLGIFLIMIGIVAAYVFNSPRGGLWLSRIGLILIIVSYFLVLLNVLLPTWVKKEETAIEECQQLVDVSNVLKTITCLFVGYAPSKISGATEVTYVNFIIAAIISPFVFFFYIFRDLMNDMNFPSSNEAKNVIAFIGAYAALRGALASYFVHFFVYGWFGMGAFAFGVFMILMAWSLVGKLFKGFTYEQDVKKLLQVLTGKYRPLSPEAFLAFLSNLTYSAVESRKGSILDFIETNYGKYLRNRVELALRIAESSKDKTAAWKKGVEDIIKERAF